MNDDHELPSVFTVHGFLRCYEQDFAAGCVRPLAGYLALFPGSPEAVTREFQRWRPLDRLGNRRRLGHSARTA